MDEAVCCGFNEFIVTCNVAEVTNLQSHYEVTDLVVTVKLGCLAVLTCMPSYNIQVWLRTPNHSIVETLQLLCSRRALPDFTNLRCIFSIEQRHRPPVMLFFSRLESSATTAPRIS